jgi:hypothetical protein
MKAAKAQNWAVEPQGKKYSTAYMDVDLSSAWNVSRVLFIQIEFHNDQDTVTCISPNHFLTPNVACWLGNATVISGFRI